MKAEQISDALNWLDDSIIDETNRVRRKRRLSDKQAKWKIIAAACACIGIMCILYTVKLDGVTRQELPMLQLYTSSDAMGFEAWRDLSEMDNGNPWNEDMELEKLPVYHNNAYHPAGVPLGLSEASLREIAETTAKALHMTIIAISDTVSQEWMTDVEPGIILSITATAVNKENTLEAEILAEADGHVRIEFTGEMLLTQAYLQDEKKLTEILGYMKPEKMERQNELIFYDSSGDEISDILNYNFNHTTFIMNDEGDSIKMIHKCEELSCAEKIGDYPIITAEKAKKLLLKGKYLEFPYELPGEKYIAGVELVYRTGRLEKTFMPYYRFWVELPELQEDNGLKCYGAYYVPAVEERYISNPIR